MLVSDRCIFVVVVLFFSGYLSTNLYNSLSFVLCRMFDPRVNMVEAEWSPFKPVKWAMPLLTEFSDWRGMLTQIENKLGEENEYIGVTFVADFPGMLALTFISYHVTLFRNNFKHTYSHCDLCTWALFFFKKNIDIK